jgi:hypothetical protein
MVRRVAAAQATLDKFKGRPCALGAKKALKRLGYDTLAEAMDGNGFERIPPAAAVVGDVIEMPGLEGPGALAVALGNGRAVAYHEDAIGAVVVQPSQMLAAWRVT